MSEEMVTITVDGQELQAPKGAMLIEVTDKANIRVPRFCYHEKLSVAANCRMCLVEVEKAPKPLPACATPVMEGMVVHTRSKTSLDAQKSIMEFLLINHPLDCPICDQGGECELQDLAMGYGHDDSDYVEGKRVVLDKNIGPLISTELTRCIHCTRCVRFGEEIAGIRELGMTGRGENARIATYVAQTVSSEMSGNVIDLCPVGALTAKPSRFNGRAWEMTQHASVAPHDCIGSNIYVHSLRGEVMRVVPRDNEAINETWISDRDRFSYEGIHSKDRLTAPMVKRDGEWETTDWDTALRLASSCIQDVVSDKKLGANKLAGLVSASSTLEELYLAQKLWRSLGCSNIDHRLRQTDFSDQAQAPVMPWLGQNVEDLEKLDAALLIGSNIRKEQPIASHRLRKAALNNDAKIHFVNTRTYDFNYPVVNNVVVAQQNFAQELAAVAAAAYQVSGAAVPAYLKAVVSSAASTDVHNTLVEQLKAGNNTTVLLGEQANRHPDFSVLRALANAIATETGSVLGYLSESSNSVGAWLAGATPHRDAAGNEQAEPGFNVAQMLENSLALALLLNVEPDVDSVFSHALMDTLKRTDIVIALSAYDSPALRETADILLPTACFTETSGTYVNAEGFWQSVTGVTPPVGEARPGWKILRVLGNLLKLEGFDHMSSEQVRDELRTQCEGIELSNEIRDPQAIKLQPAGSNMMRSGDVPMYSGDAVLRRASSLQKTHDAQTMCVRLNSADVERLGLNGLELVRVKQGDASAQLTLVTDDSIPMNSAWIPLVVKGNELLGDAFGEIVLEKA